MITRTVYTESLEQTSVIYGSLDANINAVEQAFDVSIVSAETDRTAGNALMITGNEEATDKAASAIEYLKRVAVSEGTISEQSLHYIIDLVRDGRESELEQLDNDCICLTSRGKPIKAKTAGQKKYVKLIEKNTVVLGVGPAGTGKTFLAVAMAVTALRKKEVNRIVLTRPAVEAGERLGYLPGDLQSKIDPYLRPLYDALHEMLGSENYARYVERGIIEIAPLAYMRGRTLDDSYIILDEAQNTTPEQMKMFLTRLGFNSKAIVTGDVTQTDLPFGKKSGLVDAIKILDGIDDIAIHRFTERDVVRHRLVQKIITAYEKAEKERNDRPYSESTYRFRRTR